KREASSTQVQRLQPLLEVSKKSMNDDFVKHCKNDRPLVNKEYISQLERELSLGKKVAVINEASGSGKSSSAAVIARHFQSKNQLGAMLFYNDELPDSADSKKAVKSLVFNLCLLSYEYATEVIRRLEENQTFIADNDSNRMFQILICELLSSLDPIAELIVVVIDLEIQDKQHDSLLDMLSYWMSNMPSSMRLVVSSKESDRIASTLPTEPLMLHTPKNLRRRDTFAHCIRLLNENRFNHDTGSVEEAAEVLLDLSGCNFAWLVVAEHYLQMQTAGISIESIRDMAPHPGATNMSFGRLLELIMLEYSRWPNAELDVLGLVLSALASDIYRQTAVDLADLIGADRAAVARALRQLGSLVSYSVGDAAGEMPRVGIVHKLLAVTIREELPDMKALSSLEQLSEIRSKSSKNGQLFTDHSSLSPPTSATASDATRAAEGSGGLGDAAGRGGAPLAGFVDAPQSTFFDAALPSLGPSAPTYRGLPPHHDHPQHAPSGADLHLAASYIPKLQAPVAYLSPAAYPNPPAQLAHPPMQHAALIHHLATAATIAPLLIAQQVEKQFVHRLPPQPLPTGVMSIDIFHIINTYRFPAPEVLAALPAVDDDDDDADPIDGGNVYHAEGSHLHQQPGDHDSPPAGPSTSTTTKTLSRLDLSAGPGTRHPSLVSPTDKASTSSETEIEGDDPFRPASSVPPVPPLPPLPVFPVARQSGDLAGIVRVSSRTGSGPRVATPSIASTDGGPVWTNEEEDVNDAFEPGGPTIEGENEDVLGEDKILDDEMVIYERELDVELDDDNDEFEWELERSVYGEPIIAPGDDINAFADVGDDEEEDQYFVPSRSRPLTVGTHEWSPQQKRTLVPKKVAFDDVGDESEAASNQEAKGSAGGGRQRSSKGKQLTEMSAKKPPPEEAQSPSIRRVPRSMFSRTPAHQAPTLTLAQVKELVRTVPRDRLLPLPADKAQLVHMDFESALR
ncbi:hypothetical protein HK405_003865, partial [Cladochytrium tenue]